MKDKLCWLEKKLETFFTKACHVFPYYSTSRQSRKGWS